MHILSTGKSLALAALLGGCILTAATAQAQTITFEGYAPAGGAAEITPTSPYTEAGFVFTPLNNRAAIFDSAANAQLGGTTTDYLDFESGNTVTLTRSGGGSFNLTSLLLGPVFSPSNGTGTSNITITGFQNGQAVSTYSTGALTTGMMVNLGGSFNNLDSAVFSAVVTGSARSGFDNVSVTAVPEPSEYAVGGMFGATLLLGIVRAKRRSASKNTSQTA